MPITPREFDFRVSQLQSLPSRETSRLVGFVEWLESDETTKGLLTRLRAEDLEGLLKDAGPRRAPQPKSPAEVAALGLWLIDACRTQDCDLFRLAHSVGVIISGSKVQDYSNALLDRYIHPFFDFLENELFDEMPARIVDIPDEQTNTSEVFVVHGRDNETKETVARFISKLGLNPIILHEQANKGRTIIEKFEDHAEVQFAVILLTPDEVGRLVSTPDAEFEHQSRQNVIFEMGFFIGRIGRARVFALKKGNVQVPSDYNGVVYTTMDPAGAWKLELVRELRAAGFEVDANKAL